MKKRIEKKIWWNFRSIWVTPRKDFLIPRKRLCFEIFLNNSFVPSQCTGWWPKLGHGKNESQSLYLWLAQSILKKSHLHTTKEATHVFWWVLLPACSLLCPMLLWKGTCPVFATWGASFVLYWKLWWQQADKQEKLGSSKTAYQVVLVLT